MLHNFKKVLVLAPHTDDGEFGCGGTIAKLIKGKTQVFYVAFSSAEKSIPRNLPKDTLKKELVCALKILDLPLKNLTLFSYEVRDFPQHRQAILESMVKLNKNLKPDLVLLPSTHDTHQDHQTINQEGFRAFKTCSMLGYEIPWNNLTFDTNSFVLLEPEHLEKKIQAIACYQSQSKRVGASSEFIKSLAITRGRQIGTNGYAEAFEIIRWIIK